MRDRQTDSQSDRPREREREREREAKGIAAAKKKLRAEHNVSCFSMRLTNERSFVPHYSLPSFTYTDAHTHLIP